LAAPDEDISQPLTGIRVLDLSGDMGVYCGKLLADVGADVIKVEPPGGDAMRRTGPFVAGADAPENSLNWRHYNTNKRSITLDLGSDAGRQLLQRLAGNADVLLESFQPGYLDSQGLGYEGLSDGNPGLVYASLTPFGKTGPYRDWKASELNLYAIGGLMNITGEPEQEPLREGMPLAQLGAGQNAFAATMAALMYAEETGEGQQIDVSIAEYATNILENALMQFSYSGQEYSRVGNRGYGRAAWGIYPCQNGHVGIIAGPDQRWPEVARIMKREELSDPRFTSRAGRLEHADEVDAYMLPFLIDNDKIDIFKAGQESGLGFSFVATMEDILQMEQLLDRDYFVELEHPVAGKLTYPGAPIMPEDSVDAWVFKRAPLLGEHTAEALTSWLGYSGAQVSELVDQGVLAQSEGV